MSCARRTGAHPWFTTHKGKEKTLLTRARRLTAEHPRRLGESMGVKLTSMEY